MFVSTLKPPFFKWYPHFEIFKTDIFNVFEFDEEFELLCELIDSNMDNEIELKEFEEIFPVGTFAFFHALDEDDNNVALIFKSQDITCKGNFFLMSRFQYPFF